MDWHHDGVDEQTFYTDRLKGPATGQHEALTSATSRGLLGLIQAKIDANWLAEEFPEQCSDGGSIAGTNLATLSLAMKALIPGLPWPLLNRDASTSDETVFDLVEFVAVRVSKPTNLKWHDFMRHYELRFDREDGAKEFRSEVNLVLRRGRTSYELRTNGEVHRRGTYEVQEVIGALKPVTGDDRLDELIVEARDLYTSHRPGDRAVALERLWDAFERLKTIDLPGGDKKQSLRMLLSNLEPGWRDTIEAEMKALTQIGNDYSIRHHETRTKPIPAGSAADYLFARMGALVTELLTASARIEPPPATMRWPH